MTHPTDDSLKPCPFCGGAAKVSVMRDESIWSHEIVPYTKVECGDCDIGTDYLCEGWEPTAQEAWNTRALLAEQARTEPDLDTQRADFHKWCATNGYKTDFVEGGECPMGLPVYADHKTHAAWWAFQKAAKLYAAPPLKAEQAKDAAEDAPSAVELLARVIELEKALSAMLTHMGMDEDEWNKPTFDQARAALRKGHYGDAKTST